MGRLHHSLCALISHPVRSVPATAYQPWPGFDKRTKIVFDILNTSMKRPSSATHATHHADDTELGARLRQARQRAGLSLRALAGRASVTAGTLSLIENGRHSPSVGTLRKILAPLSLPLGGFFAGVPVPTLALAQAPADAKIHELIRRARRAQQIVEYWPQEKVNLMVAAVGWELYRQANAVRCARLAFRETGIGVYADKLLKHRKKTLGTLRDLAGIRTVGVVEIDEARGLAKLAKPVGIVAAITPVTNPTSTPACNGLTILKGRNAVIFGPHPRARRATGLVVELMRAGLRKVGAPEDLVQALPEPSKETARTLMSAADLVVASGAGALVRAAYSSGTPAYGVGAGNACVVVDETASLADAAEKIALSKTFDNATSCSSENSLIVQAGVWKPLLAALRSHGGHLCSMAEKRRLQAVLWPDGVHLNPALIARPAPEIAKAANIAVPAGTRFLLVAGAEPLEKDPFSLEKLSPVLTLWKYAAFGQAVSLVARLTRHCGHGHSCGIHSVSEAHILELATRCHVSRMMVNQPQCYANSGNYDNGMPFTMTLGCGTWGRNITSENVSWKHFLNFTWVSRPIPPVVPDECELFGAYWRKYGK